MSLLSWICLNMGTLNNRWHGNVNSPNDTIRYHLGWMHTYTHTHAHTHASRQSNMLHTHISGCWNAILVTLRNDVNWNFSASEKSFMVRGICCWIWCSVCGKTERNNFTLHRYMDHTTTTTTNRPTNTSNLESCSSHGHGWMMCPAFGYVGQKYTSFVSFLEFLAPKSAKRQRDEVRKNVKQQQQRLQQQPKKWKKTKEFFLAVVLCVTTTTKATMPTTTTTIARLLLQSHLAKVSHT